VSIAEAMCCSKETARYHLDDLILLDLAKRRTVLSKKAQQKYQWQLKDAEMLRKVLKTG